MATREQIPALAGELVKHQAGFSALSTADAQAAILDIPAFIARACEAWANRAVVQVQETEGCLRLISGAETLTLDPTDGTEHISGRNDVFTGWIDPDFGNYGCNVIGQPSKVANVQVCEMIKSGDFRKIYGGLGDNLDAMCLTQGQIVLFVTKYPQWLRADGYGTFFLFKVRNEFFVADVDVYSDSLDAGVSRFSHGSVWDADDRPRFVIPQLTPGI
jgi:hypothetical protein